MALSMIDLINASAIIRVVANDREAVVRAAVKNKAGLIDTAALLSDAADAKHDLADRLMAEV